LCETEGPEITKVDLSIEFSGNRLANGDYNGGFADASRAIQPADRTHHEKLILPS